MNPSKTVRPEDDDGVALQPLDALRQLLDHPGYALLLRHVREEWGAAAQNRKIRQDLANAPADHRALAVSSIVATADEIFKIFTWVDEEIDRQLAAAKQPPQPADPYAQHRRIAG